MNDEDIPSITLSDAMAAALKVLNETLSEAMGVDSVWLVLTVLHPVTQEVATFSNLEAQYLTPFMIWMAEQHEEGQFYDPATPITPKEKMN